MTSTLHRLGWDERLESLFAPFESSNLIPARVTRVDRGVLVVQSETATAPASTVSQLDPSGERDMPAVGDWVGMDLVDGVGVIQVILPRTGGLRRRRLGESDQERVVAANVDLVFVVEPLDRGPNPRRIERATAIAWAAGAKPIVVLTKADLCDDHDAAFAAAREGAPFVDVLMVAARFGMGHENVAERLTEGTTAVLLGPAGSGRSTLANCLLGEQRLEVREVRGADGKASRTTKSRELFVLPGGGCLIDTPGVRELGLWLDPETAMTAFDEIEEAARRCFFGDCRHQTEPGCAVLDEVELGKLNARRLASYLRLRREEEKLDLRRDESRRDEIRAGVKSSRGETREVIKRKNDR
jgi:ribosome biogenesis GTPase